MSSAALTQYWALVAAVVIAIAALIAVMMRILKASARGRLASELNHLAEREKAQRAARKALEKAEQRLARLRENADTAKPRHVQETKDAIAAAGEELRMIDDHVLIARNRVRTVILEEYPPQQQVRLRRRYLGEDAAES